MLLKLNNINLIRTNSYYKTETIKSFFTTAIMSPIKSLLSSQVTEFYLENINLSIENNERVAILGSNGSGKSTLCRLIASQLFASSGTITNSFEIGLFSQIDRSFYKELSGRENLKYFIKFIYNKLSKQEQAVLLQEAVVFSQLGSAIDRQVETYSTGMVSRLALSLILAKKHDLLILDEIQSHTDIGFRNKVSERVKNIIKTSNTVIIVSHFLDEIKDLCTRGIVLENGKIIFDGNIDKAVACYRLSNGSSLA